MAEGNEVNEMVKIRDVIKGEFDQFVLVNKSINNINDSIEDINNKSSEYNDKIKKSKDHVNNLIKKHRKEKYMLYISFYFFVICCLIVIIRRIPLFLLIKWMYYLLDLIISIIWNISDLIINTIPIDSIKHVIFDNDYKVHNITRDYVEFHTNNMTKNDL